MMRCPNVVVQCGSSCPRHQTRLPSRIAMPPPFFSSGICHLSHIYRVFYVPDTSRSKPFASFAVTAPSLAPSLSSRRRASPSLSRTTSRASRPVSTASTFSELQYRVRGPGKRTGAHLPVRDRLPVNLETTPTVALRLAATTTLTVRPTAVPRTRSATSVRFCYVHKLVILFGRAGKRTN